jgi:hypothetical protein
MPQVRHEDRKTHNRFKRSIPAAAWPLADVPMPATV